MDKYQSITRKSTLQLWKYIRKWVIEPSNFPDDWARHRKITTLRVPLIKEKHFDINSSLKTHLINTLLPARSSLSMLSLLRAIVASLHRGCQVTRGRDVCLLRPSPSGWRFPGEALRLGREAREVPPQLGLVREKREKFPPPFLGGMRK